ncbi:unnamed protein product [Cylindrotheca closterium]|uniref:Uncharacterized protein n=1 Tax=Cylindrotheca closterium TaxID=2856 RepID=A0AAD2CGA0_9STRA|nr:unnamed protein product [Cylindrotheca closterium]
MGAAEEVVSMMNNKGILMMGWDNYKKGEECFRQALLVAQGAVRNGDPKRIPMKLGEGIPSGRSYMKSLHTNLSELVSPSTNRLVDNVPNYRPEYDEGMDNFREYFDLVNKSNNMIGTILFNMGRLAQNQRRFRDALKYYWESLVALKFVGFQSEPAECAALSCIGQIQYISGDFESSLETYHMALPLTETVFGRESIEVAACHNAIGILHYVSPKGDNEIGMKALQKSLYIRLKHQGRDHLDVGTTWNNIGRLYFHDSKYYHAMAAYDESLRIRKLHHRESADVAATLFNIGQIYHQDGELEKALAAYHEFKRMITSQFGQDHRDVCMAATFIGNLCLETNDYDAAIKSFEQAIRVGRLVLGWDHPDIGIALNQLGMVHCKAGDPETALKVYHQALKFEVGLLRKTGTNRNLCVTYMNIAEIYNQKSNHKQALHYFYKLLCHQKKCEDEKSEIANTLMHIGFNKQQLGDIDGAFGALQECLRLRRESLGNWHEDVAAVLTDTAVLLMETEKRGIALSLLNEAYRIKSALSSEKTKDLGYILYNIALIYHREGDMQHSLRFYLETLAVEQVVLGDNHCDLSITHFNIAQILNECNQPSMAINHFQKALEIERKCYGNQHPTVARTLNQIGNVELARGNLSDSMECYSESLRIYRDAGLDCNQLRVHGEKLWRFETIHPKAAATA